LALGMSVKRTQQEVNSREFAEWGAYYRLEPFGEWRADVRSASVAHILANANAPKGRTYTMDDFMYFERKEPKTNEERAEEMQKALKAFAQKQRSALKKMGK